MMICVATFCIGGKCSVVLCLKNRKYGGVSSLSFIECCSFNSDVPPVTKQSNFAPVQHVQYLPLYVILFATIILI